MNAEWFVISGNIKMPIGSTYAISISAPGSFGAQTENCDKQKIDRQFRSHSRFSQKIPLHIRQLVPESWYCRFEILDIFGLSSRINMKTPLTICHIFG